MDPDFLINYTDKGEKVLNDKVTLFPRNYIYIYTFL